MTACLFIGGCLDGVRRDVADDQGYYRAPVPLDPVLDTPSPGPVQVQVDDYKRKGPSLFVLHPMSDDEATAHLLKNYRPPALNQVIVDADFFEKLARAATSFEPDFKLGTRAIEILEKQTT